MASQLGLYDSLVFNKLCSVVWVRCPNEYCGFAVGLTSKHFVFIIVGSSIGFFIQFKLLAHYWRFPVPFYILLGNPGWQMSWHACLRLAIGTSRWRENPENKKQIIVVNRVGSIQSVLVLIYPVYNAIFLRLHGLAKKTISC